MFQHVKHCYHIEVRIDEPRRVQRTWLNVSTEGLTRLLRGGGVHFHACDPPAPTLHLPQKTTRRAPNVEHTSRFRVQLFDKAHSLSILESVDLIPQHVAQTNEATSSYRLFFGVLTVWSEIVWVVGWKAILCRARFEIYETAAPAPHQPKPNDFAPYRQDTKEQPVGGS